jgi:hypothetical protein
MKALVWFWNVLICVSVALLAVAHAATYNIYFNNTEQGPNSTASPSMTVTGAGGPPVAQPSPAVTASGQSEATAPAPAPVPQNISVQTSEAPRAEPRESRWTITGMYSVGSNIGTQEYMPYYGGGYSGYDSYYESNQRNMKMYSLSGAYRLHRTFSAGVDVGLRTYTSDYSYSDSRSSYSYADTRESLSAGVSLEWLPISFQLGSHRLIEAGPIVQGLYDFGREEINAFIGARAVVNFTPSIGIVGSYKRGFQTRTEYQNQWFEAGLRAEL